MLQSLIIRSKPVPLHKRVPLSNVAEYRDSCALNKQTKSLNCRCLSNVAYVIEIKMSLVPLILVVFSTVTAKRGCLMWRWVLRSMGKLTQLPKSKDHSPSIDVRQPRAASPPWLVYGCNPSSCNSDNWEGSGVLRLI